MKTAWRQLVLAAVAALSLWTGALPAEAGDHPVCAACGLEIKAGRYLQDQWKACYHVEHAHIRRCDYCARGISEYNTHGGVHYPDGRDVCNICQGTAVMDEGTAMSIEADARSRMEAWGLHFPYGAIPIKLVDQPTLRKMFNHHAEIGDGKINGLTTKRWMKDTKGRILNHDVSIAMLYGMPAEVFEKTVAHELMHAWIFLDREPEHTLDLEEGTCNLTSYYFLQERQDPLAGFLREAMFKSSNPVYGEGLRRAIRYVQANKFTGLVKMLRTHKDFPTGY